MLTHSLEYRIKMESLFRIFQSLKQKSSIKKGEINVESLKGKTNHKIGVSKEGRPLFFIKCDNLDNLRSLDCNLEYIGIQYNRECQLNNNEENLNGIYTIVSLNTDSIELQEYFIEIVFLIVSNLSDTPFMKDLKMELDKLTNLFSTFSKPPLKTVQGLWAEILVIEQSNNPDYLIKSWHIFKGDKFDFNDGNDKIEVKSTSKSKRIHTFSIQQLNPNNNSQLIIASIFAIETGIGKNIINLIEDIEKRLKDKTLYFKLNEIVTQTLGKDFIKSFDMFFDYHFAVDNIGYYLGENIPRIDENDVPRDVINIRFDCDLTNIKPVQDYKGDSILHKSLGRL